MIRTHPNDPPLTAGETTRLAWLTARMAKRGLAGEDVDLSDLQKKFDAVIVGAWERAARTATPAKKGA